VHRRFALWVLCKIGTGRPRLVLAAFMLLSWLMSQWLSNTCTAAMLVPMAHTICESLCDIEKAKTRGRNLEYEKSSHEAQVTSPAEGDQSSTAPHRDCVQYDVPPEISSSVGFFRRVLCLCVTSNIPPHLARLRATERYSKALLLGIAYSCSIGGVSTLVGTATNLMLASQIRTLFPKYGDLNFAIWMLFATPLSFILLIVLYCWLLVFFVRGYGWHRKLSNFEVYMESGEGNEIQHCVSPTDVDTEDVHLVDIAASSEYIPREEERDDKHIKSPLLLSPKYGSGDLNTITEASINDDAAGNCVPLNANRSSTDRAPSHDANAMLQRELDSLGRVRIEEICVMTLFLLLCILWITRDMSFFKTNSSGSPIGWSALFYWLTGKNYVSDATCAIIVCVLLFIVPARTDGAQRTPQTSSDSSSPNQKLHFLMDWKWVQTRLPWRIVLLLGAGFALSVGLEKGGFSEYIGEIMAALGERIPVILFLFILCTTVTMLTEVSSNVATCALLLPILAHLSKEMGQNPFLLMIPAALCCSFAFMLPISTPPNAIAYSYGFITMRDMVSFGVVLNFSALVISVLYTLGMGRLVLGIRLGEVPDWAT